MIADGSGKLPKISFNDIRDALKGSKGIRQSVLTFLAAEFGAELVKKVEVVAKKPLKPKK